MAAPNWHVIHKTHGGSNVAQFAPQNLSFTLNKGENGPHDVSYEASRGQDAVFPGFVGPYVTDFELWRDEQKLITGMHTALNVESGQESVAITGKSFLHYLERRIWPFDSSDVNLWRLGLHLSAASNNVPPTGYSYYETLVEVKDVLKDMLDVILMDDNCLDFTYNIPGIGHTLETFSIGLPDNESILSKIKTLSQEDPGEFDFWMDANKVFRVRPGRQYDLAVVNDPQLAEHIFDASFPESGFMSVSFTNTGPDATWLLGQGEAVLPASTRQYVPASEQFRRLDNSVSFGYVPSTTRVSRLTRKALLFGLNPVHEITLVVAPEKVRDFWTRFVPGKAIWIRADMEGWIVDSAQEIVSIQCNVDLNGNEEVTFALNQIYDVGVTLTL